MAAICPFDFPIVRSQLGYDSIFFNSHHRKDVLIGCLLNVIRSEMPTQKVSKAGTIFK